MVVHDSPKGGCGRKSAAIHPTANVRDQQMAVQVTLGTMCDWNARVRVSVPVAGTGRGRRSPRARLSARRIAQLDPAAASLLARYHVEVVDFEPT